jgi:hypothetical protein
LKNNTANNTAETAENIAQYIRTRENQSVAIILEFKLLKNLTI